MKFKTIGNTSGKADDAKPGASKAAATDDIASSSLNRRSFLKDSSAAGVGIGLIVTSKSALGQTKTSDKTLRCGIIGFGEEGEALRASSQPLTESGEVAFTAVADVWSDNLRAGVGRVKANKQGGGADGQGCTGYEDPQDMIDKEDLDCILVATPDFVHHTHSIMGLEAGLDVYCEKLMSNRVEWAAEMVKAQRSFGKLLQIGHQRRSNPRYLHARDKIVHEQKLLGWITHMSAQWNRGKSSSVPRPIPKTAIPDETLAKYGYNTGATGMFEFRNWRMYKKFGGGVISDLGAHQIDLFNWFLESVPVSVFAQGGTDYYTGEYLHAYLTGDIKEKLAKTKSTKMKAKLEAQLAVYDQIKDGYEYADNVMAFYEYDTPRSLWDTQGGSGDVLKTRAYYQVLTTTSSQKFYEKFMGENATMAISELDTYNQIYREAHDERYKLEVEGAKPWSALETGDEPVIQKTIAKVYNRFWEKPTPWRAVSEAKKNKWLDGTLSDARVSAPLDAFELPEHVHFKERPHTPHLRNFFETVANGGKQEDLNCTAEEGYKTAVTCIKVHEAIATGQKLEFKPEDFVV